MLAYRLISGDSLLINRSFCPHCKKTIAWYDLIPVLSWILLKRRCRSCHYPISWLYPFIELISLISFFSLIWLLPESYWFAYGIFFSALIITIRTDFEHMLICRYATIFLIPLGFLFASFGYLPLYLENSIVGSLSAYIFLYGLNWIFFIVTNKNGLGQGDGELLAFIGSFLGVSGWWLTLMIGSFFGSFYGILTIIINQKSKSTLIPFGPFLALGAILTTFFQHKLYYLFGF